MKNIKKMKNLLNKSLIAFLLTAALSVCQNINVSAQTAKRISFAKGTTSTIVKGLGKQAYIIRIGAGQICKIQLISARNAAMLEVFDAEGMDLTEGSDGHSFEGSFENAGDYQIKVSASAKLAYTMKITIKK